MHHHNRDTHVLVDEDGRVLPTSGTREEMQAEAQALIDLGYGPIELRAIGDEPKWQWEMCDWGD